MSCVSLCVCDTPLYIERRYSENGGLLGLTLIKEDVNEYL